MLAALSESSSSSSSSSLAVVWSGSLISVPQDFSAMHLADAFGHQTCVHFSWCALIRCLLTFLILFSGHNLVLFVNLYASSGHLLDTPGPCIWTPNLCPTLLVHSPSLMLARFPEPLSGLFSSWVRNVKYWGVTLLCKVLSGFSVMFLGALGCAVIFPFSGILSLCFSCKSLGFLQDGTEVIKCWLLNNLRLKIIIWFLHVCFLFMSKISSCVSDSVRIKVVCMTHLETSAPLHSLHSLHFCL